MTPMEYDTTEEGRRQAYTQLATSGLALVGVACISPVLLGDGTDVPRALLTASTSTAQVPWLMVAGCGALALWLWDFTRRVPRRVVGVHKAVVLVDTARTDIPAPAGVLADGSAAAL